MTIGHSTLALDVFLGALRDNGCDLLVDVRTVPRSRHNPQFAQENLPASLKAAGIRYLWMKELGGLRHTLKDSINTAWKNASFRGYADYMQTAEFAAAVRALLALPQLDRVCIMCAEAVPWRCHRSMIADAAIARGYSVDDIFVAPNGTSARKPHSITKFARVKGDRVWYPPADDLFAER